MPPRRLKKRKKNPKLSTSDAAAPPKGAAAAAEAVATNNRQPLLEEQLESLQQEMEFAQYGKTKTGQSRRVLPRDQMADRTRKRKQLESQDVEELAMEQQEYKGSRRRLRGSRAAEEDDIIQGSLVFGGVQQSSVQEESETVRENDEEQEFFAEADENEVEDDEEGVDEGDSVDEDAEIEGDDEPAKKPAAKGAVRRPKKRRMYRLRNFRSQRMARRHGDAMGAHTRGKPKEAIEKLKQVAHDAPSAPQVYSSLGMVYEDMLRQASERQWSDHEDVSQAETSAHARGEGEAVPDKALAEQLDLAKKAYGSYHVAAVLCKKDFALWVRAADSACEIADIHAAIILHPGTSDSLRQYHRTEKQRWLAEAQNDFSTADKLNPPGIDVPAKLASVSIELGQFSEALTILTDLKNQKPAMEGRRSDFESSYKAWLLYAELMLRIGHECNQWNSGVQTNGNFMFRRWLRKHSKSFDWQERRLQALVKAFEASAGSKSCMALVEWSKKRAAAHDTEGEYEPLLSGDTTRVAEEQGDRPCDSSNRESLSGRMDDSMSTDQLEREKGLLIEKNRLELAAFDKTTSEMSLDPGLEPSKQREKVRRELVEKQKVAMVELNTEFRQDQGFESSSSRQSSGHKDEELNSSGEQEAPLTLSASLKTVCGIASELIRLLLEQKLYEGGRLAGEAVSLYLKERAALLDKRLDARRKFEQNQMRQTNVFAVAEEYDVLGEANDGDESDTQLSDDDELESSGSTVMHLLRGGALPPEVSVLYALSLTGEGGRNFVACKCLESIDALEQESLAWLREPWVDTDVASNSQWSSFQYAKTAPLGRTAAYAFVADTLHAAVKEKEFAVCLAPLFRAQAEKLAGDMLSEALAVDVCSQFVKQKKTQVIKVVLASMRYQMNRAEGMEDLEKGETRKLVITCIEQLSMLLPALWNVLPDGSITTTCVEIVNTTARAFRLLLSEGLSEETTEHAKKRLDDVEKMKVPVAAMCNLGSFAMALACEIPELRALPFPSSWLTPEKSALALRATSLCVSTNVSLFSGWAEQEFNLDLLRKRNTYNYCEVAMRDDRVVGILSVSCEEELIKQWDLIRTQLPMNGEFDFQTELSSLRESTWYKQARENHDTATAKYQIARFGEGDGLSVLLCFSRMCLLLAKEGSEKSLKANLLLTAMSIVLPVSQFCLCRRLWDSQIGHAIESTNSLEHYRTFSAEAKKHDVLPPPSQRPGYIRRAKRLSLEKAKRLSLEKQSVQTDKALHEWFSGENDQSPLSNIVVIPCAELLAEWKRASSRNAMRMSDPLAAAEAMARVNTCLRQLRCCYSETSVERASLNIAAALVNLVSFPQCRNPFLCLQQAALFASQAAKLGTSDLPFKSPLPEVNKCTPTEALVILGRGECLQALHFCHEAAFLCSYVASECRHRRHGQNGEREWNAQQVSIVCLLAYNLSVSIRYTANVVLSEQVRKEDHQDTWERDLIEELRRGRDDGLTWKSEIASAAGGVKHTGEERWRLSPKFMIETEGEARKMESLPLQPRGHREQSFDEDDSSNAIAAV